MHLQVQAKYDARLPISIKKKQDLIKLCDIGAMPSHNRVFYDSFPCPGTTDRLTKQDL